jgi:aldehyde dehydrogenase (NAD+)
MLMSMVSSHEVASKALPEPALWIGGTPVTSTSSGMTDRINPTTGTVLSSFPIAGAAEVDQAVAAAKAAFPAWRRMSADVRRELLHRIARRLDEAGEEFRTIIALETGTPISRASMRSAVDWFEYYAGWVDKFAGELVPTYPRRALDYVTYEPYGVVGALVPWNAPVITAAKKLAPAFAAGNCVVMKSPELGPFAVMRLAEICQEAGLPDGVLSVLSGGPEAGEAIIRHPDVRKVSFTGGPVIASRVMSVASESTTPLVLELGGKSANIVFADADLDRAAQMSAYMATVASSGQGCLFPTRLLVQDSVYDEVIDRVRAVAEAAVIGDPLDLGVTMGPVISEGACERILGFIDEAKSTGTGRLVTGGKRVGDELAAGCFIQPTVLADVENTSRIAQEEVFGPVLTVMRFTDEAEAVRLANDSRYGLAAYIHTKDLVRAHTLAADLEAGFISLNAFPPMGPTAPFGGNKASGFGREGGRAGIEEYVQQKNVYIPLD